MADAMTLVHRALKDAHRAIFQAAQENGWTYCLDDANKLVEDAMTQVQCEIDAKKAGEEARFIAYQV